MSGRYLLNISTFCNKAWMEVHFREPECHPRKKRKDSLSSRLSLKVTASGYNYNQNVTVSPMSSEIPNPLKSNFA